MISICIPVFRFDVTPLVNQLVHQANELNLDYEIVLIDDGSKDASVNVNAKLAEWPHVRWEALPHNVGRSRIRNLLAEQAQYPYLLYMDCDSAVPNENYLKQYVAALNPDVLLYGGRVYEVQPPQNPDFILHWTYGINREQSTAEQRKAAPYKSFMTNNFVVPKTIFQSIKLDETLRGYGHEDTLFGKELKERNIPILHMNNPLIHIGLETGQEFLKKTEEGIQNLALLIKRGEMDKDVKLYRYYLHVKNFQGLKLLKGQFKRRKSSLEKNLLSEKPSLQKFDLFKMGLLAQALEKLE